MFKGLKKKSSWTIPILIKKGSSTIFSYCFLVVLKKYQVEKSYNHYKRQYRNYLLLVKRKNKYITYKVDSRIVSFLFQIDSVEELVFDQVLFLELLELKERLTLNKRRIFIK